VHRTALVTGGTGGLGPTVVVQLADAGWRVVVPWVTESTVDRIDRRVGIELVEADLSDPASVARVAELSARDTQAPLRGVVNLAGGFAAPGPVHEMSLGTFEHQFLANVRPTFLVVQAALPHLVAAGGGSIVCIGARAAKRPFAGASGYIASKAAVAAFARAVAAEYANDGVRCNVVLPSVIDTPANRMAMPDADRSRWVAAAEVASLIAYLRSDSSVATSGAELPVCGRA
jgi:NAD(P)-dependent dehydrogenase (short-subunit alcohol dehydrogenase family)